MNEDTPKGNQEDLRSVDHRLSPEDDRTAIKVEAAMSCDNSQARWRSLLSKVKTAWKMFGHESRRMMV